MQSCVAGFIVSNVQVENGVTTHKSVSLLVVVLVPQFGGFRIMQLFSLTVLETVIPQSSVRLPMLPLKYLEKKRVLPCLLWLLLAANNSWHYLVCGTAIQWVSHWHMALYHPCLSAFLLCKDTSNTEFRVHLNSA